MGQSKSDGSKASAEKKAGGPGTGKKVASSPMVSKKLGSPSSQENGQVKPRPTVNRSNSSARLAKTHLAITYN